MKAMPILTTLALTAALATGGCKKKEADNPTPTTTLQLVSATLVDGTRLSVTDPAANTALPLTSVLRITFGTGMDTATARTAIRLQTGGADAPYQLRFPNAQTAQISSTSELEPSTEYKVAIGNGLRGANDERFPGLDIGFSTEAGSVTMDSVQIDGVRVRSPRPQDVNYTPELKFYFSRPISAQSVQTAMAGQTFLGRRGSSAVQATLSTNGKVLTVKPQGGLSSLTMYTVTLSNQIKGSKGEVFAGSKQVFYTKLDMTDKFPRISDDELLTKVQRETFRYFWEGAHAGSGLALERGTQSPDVVTSGGSGFGVMSIIVAIDRGWVTRSEGVSRWDKQTRWLKKADRFHGVWPHWWNANTGRVRPFSPNDDGGDLVETAFMAQGLMTVRQFLNRADASEAAVANRIDSLLNEIEWDWYRKGPEQQQVLYWHWSPRVAWAMNFPLRGWNETLITYVMAAASTTHTIPRSVYEQGYCTGSHYRNGNSYYGIQLPLGFPYGGPAFFTHYSFLGLNPTRLQDANANYWTQNLNHTKINREHCVRNPNQFVLYGPECWGLTASDIPNGYTANAPDNDNGTITPTAALACMPYTPTESMEALKFFYYKMGDRIWGPQGFYDAFNPTQDWVASSYLAIDQGPIIVMIENHRTQRLWNLFMSAPEVQAGLTKLGFTY